MCAATVTRRRAERFQWRFRKSYFFPKSLLKQKNPMEADGFAVFSRRTASIASNVLPVPAKPVTSMRSFQIGCLGSGIAAPCRIADFHLMTCGAQRGLTGLQILAAGSSRSVPSFRVRHPPRPRPTTFPSQRSGSAGWRSLIRQTGITYERNAAT